MIFSKRAKNEQKAKEQKANKQRAKKQRAEERKSEERKSDCPTYSLGCSSPNILETRVGFPSISAVLLYIRAQINTVGSEGNLSSNCMKEKAKISKYCVIFVVEHSNKRTA